VGVTGLRTLHRDESGRWQRLLLRQLPELKRDASQHRISRLLSDEIEPADKHNQSEIPSEPAAASYGVAEVLMLNDFKSSGDTGDPFAVQRHYNG